MRKSLLNISGVLKILFSAVLAGTLFGCTVHSSKFPESNTPKIDSTIENSVKEQQEEFTVPEWDGTEYAIINDNQPFFEESDFIDRSFESYSDLDHLGRPGQAFACLGRDLMPKGKRESIYQIKPPGWKNNRSYDWIDGQKLYNRSHLIAWSLAGENANEKNLITGTRFMNAEGMQPFENMVGDYIKETGNHVLYRVTPVYTGDNLIADGVLMEAESVEDDGKGIKFNVFCWNVQPGIDINYKNGKNHAMKSH